MKEFLSKNNIEYTYVDISESMANLKAFLKYRDLRPEFDDVKKDGKVGVPLIVINDGEKLILDWLKLEELR